MNVASTTEGYWQIILALFQDRFSAIVPILVPPLAAGGFQRKGFEALTFVCPWHGAWCTETWIKNWSPSVFRFKSNESIVYSCQALLAWSNAYVQRPKYSASHCQDLLPFQMSACAWNELYPRERVNARKGNRQRLLVVLQPPPARVVASYNIPSQITKLMTLGNL